MVDLKGHHEENYHFMVVVGKRFTLFLLWFSGKSQLNC